MPNQTSKLIPTIGVLASWQVYAGTLNTLLRPILQGIRDSAHEQKCNVLIASGVVSSFNPKIRTAWPILSPEVDFLPVGSWNTDGLIVIAPHNPEDVKSRHLEQVIAAGHPVVFIESADRELSVSLDNADGVWQALVHLKQHGHQRVAFIGGEAGRPGDGPERLQAFLSGCQKLGLEIDQSLVAYGSFTTPGGFQAMRQIMEGRALFSAVLACNDESAIGAMQAIKAAGLRIPQDIAVIGFDNRFEARIQNPTLTTINQPAYEIGFQALELMLRRLQRIDNTTRAIRVPAKLVIRESCGCKHDALNIRALSEVSNTDGEFETSISINSVAQAMSERVFAEVGQLRMNTIQIQCLALANAFIFSINQRDGKPFESAISDILEYVKRFNEDALAWQSAISVLTIWWQKFSEFERYHNTQHQVSGWLDQARIKIAECAQFQLLRYFGSQDDFTQQLSLMSAELGEALSPAQMQSIMNRYLTALNIQHAQLILFEAQEDDPVALSILPSGFDASSPSQAYRFATRQFPPPGLYPATQPYQLALLPIAIMEKPVGYVAFDAANLIPCLAVVRQLASRLESIRLYQEAADGRRLAEEANRLKSRFLSTVSHELRTPLNLIVGLSEMQLKQPTTDVHETLQRIYTNAQHLGHLIRDVLDLASSDAGQLHLFCELLDLGETFQAVIEIGKQLAQDKGLDWQIQIPKQLPQVWGDRTRLQQVALNLIANAVKFTAQGQVSLRIEVGEKHLVVSVQDTGLGIPLDEQAWIFDEFRQSEHTAARGFGGLGLGLAICKQLIELHNGEIGVQSSGEEGHGSTFYFRLPMLDDTDKLLQDPNPFWKQTVLILANEIKSAKSLQHRLLNSGFKVEIQSVTEIPDWLSRLLSNPPGALVLDMQIASKYGMEVLKVVKENPKTKNISVLFYSFAPGQETGSMLELDYLMKPIDSDELFHSLARQGWAADEKEKSKTILIVDDELGFLDLYSEIIQRLSSSHRVLKARDGLEALHILQQTRVDLVLLDLMMPKMDGFGVLAQMRKWETTRDTAVIVLTSKTLMDADMTRLSQGVATVLGKGLYDLNEMLSRFESALNHNHKLGSESQHIARQTMAYIHEHYTEPITRADIAKQINVSEGHLARCFQRETALTPTAYLNRYRVNQAKTLLISTDQSIASIAIKVGFSDNNYFSRVFRHEIGETPLSYRRKQLA
ncbi:substrate-binding domain-containing protein [Candidatus Villigracilis saccharophilus]|uniref:substrate-binding domain-containing protein n=1 Tax=Candidatus Villigracilis saccharophilus TaxID=3140684 RepID=UPI0031361A69|nr:substrate-binding domain-containing protein [Anaerolineales bacterium]